SSSQNFSPHTRPTSNIFHSIIRSPSRHNAGELPLAVAMNLARPPQCLLCSFFQSISRASGARRKFHFSPSQLARKKPKHGSVKAANMPTSQTQTFHPQRSNSEY